LVDINQKNYLSISELHIKYASAYCFEIVNSSYIIIDNCTIEWAGNKGFELSGNEHCTLSNNTIENCGNDAMYITGGSSYIDVKNNIISKNGESNIAGDRQTIGDGFAKT